MKSCEKKEELALVLNKLKSVHYACFTVNESFLHAASHTPCTACEYVFTPQSGWNQSRHTHRCSEAMLSETHLLLFRLWGRPWCQYSRPEVLHQTPHSCTRRHEWNLLPMWKCKYLSITLICNHSNMLICGSIFYYYQCWKKWWCIILFYWKQWYILKSKRAAFFGTFWPNILNCCVLAKIVTNCKKKKILMLYPTESGEAVLSVDGRL